MGRRSRLACWAAVAEIASTATCHFLAWVVIMLALGVAAHAETVYIAGDEPRRTITVNAENSSAEQILQRLADKYGFKIKGIEHASPAEVISTKMAGSLHDVVDRLLRNRNHMIVRSPSNASGIESVMILDANYGAAASKFMPAANQTEDFMQALSGTPD